MAWISSCTSVSVTTSKEPPLLNPHLHMLIAPSTGRLVSGSYAHETVYASVLLAAQVGTCLAVTYSTKSVLGTPVPANQTAEAAAATCETV